MLHFKVVVELHSKLPIFVSDLEMIDIILSEWDVIESANLRYPSFYNNGPLEAATVSQKNPKRHDNPCRFQDSA